MALYGERGYEETTVAEIAERAGLTKRTFFRYFSDKREVLFWGSELLEQQMVAAIEAAPASAPALGHDRRGTGCRRGPVRGGPGLRRPAAPDHRLQPGAAGARADQGRVTGRRHGRALRARGIGETAAALAAWTGTTVMHVAFEQWVNDPDQAPFQRIARDALAELREIAATG